MNIGESLPRNAQHFPDKRAIVDAHRTVTYRELHERTNRLANYLLNQDIRKGDLIGLSVGSRAEHFEALFAIAKIGAIAVPFGRDRPTGTDDDSDLLRSNVDIYLAVERP